MKKMVLMLMLLMITVSMFSVNTPHPVIIEVLNEDGITWPRAVTFEAWINDTPGDVLTQDSDDCYYPYTFSGQPTHKFMHIQCGSFSDQWEAGDKLRIIAYKAESDYYDPTQVEEWHLSSTGAYDGNSWWMGESTTTYTADIHVAMFTPVLTLASSNPTLTFKMSLSCELAEAGAAMDWDGANVRISTDNGENWSVLTPTTPAYNCNYINAFERFEGDADVPGWAGVDWLSWSDVSFDLSAYAGDDVKIQFVFASDGAAQPGFGWRIDNIAIATSTSTFSSDGEGASGDDQMLYGATTKDGVVYLTDENVQVFEGSGFAPDAPLPITLSSFTATYLDDSPVLQWVTQSEESNQGWNIYRNTVEEQNSSLQVNSELVEGAGTTSEETKYSFNDQYEVESGATYYYWLESIGMNGQVESYGPVSLQIPDDGEGESPEVPMVYGLRQNYPNPFNPITNISFALKEAGEIELNIYNIKGQKIRELYKGFAEKEMVLDYSWDGFNEQGKEVGSGIYMYQLKTVNKTYTKKLNLIK